MTEAEGKITVIVPVYNAEPYLPQCIESILRQTYPNLQIILVDDGSTDGSGMICDKYAGMDGRIEVYHTENRGLVAARKLGIRCSTGKYVGFVDADDYIDPEMYETQEYFFQIVQLYRHWKSLGKKKFLSSSDSLPACIDAATDPPSNKRFFAPERHTPLSESPR